MTTADQLSVPAWGKYESPDCYHRLEHHCADVAACFEVLVQDPVVGSRFARAAGEGNVCAVTEARLAVIAFLHDFAKLNSGFQFKVRDRRELPADPPPKMGHIGEAFFCFEQADICEALGFPEMVAAWGPGVVSLLLGALSHHGRPPHKLSYTSTGPPKIWKPFAGYDPCETAAMLHRRVRAWFPEAFRWGPPLPESPALAHLFAGTVTLSDQIGSAKEYFRFEPDPDPNYIYRARELARRVMEKRGFCRAGRPARAEPADFQTMFVHETPRPAQRAVAEAPLDCPLLILESETGSGKTEAAVIRFAALWRAGFVDGLYFAVPTRAAAKQLHRRIDNALRRLFPAEAWAETVLAIPGYYVAGTGTGYPTGKFQVYWEDKPDEEERAARWSAESVRHFLSSTAAVGTVDQALLGGLKVKWAHLRGASLARSLLVVDEVHASDAYMTELLRSLLQGHLDLGGHALLMSATLGATARTALSTRRVRATPPEPDESEATPYPALTLVGDGTPEIHRIKDTGRSKETSMRVEPWLADPGRVAELAYSLGKKGAKVLVIRNTVATAQAVFDELLLNEGGDELALAVAGVPAVHHSRFAVEDRLLLDDAVEQVLSKERPLQGGRVVIGTQTLEQSLDIDADFLISDLCPVDVLLQRIGRLHRHRGTQRAEACAMPCCVVLAPAEGLEIGIDGGLSRHGLGMSRRGGGIYRNLLAVEQTQSLLVEHPVWRIPEMNRMLVERATHPDVLRKRAEILGGRWLTQEQQTWGVAAAEGQLARNHILDRTKPFDEKLAFSDLDEKVRTRLGEDGPRIKLAKPVPGPFGAEVGTFNLPAHVFGGADSLPTRADIDEASAERTADGLVLQVGSRVFRYDNRGLRVMES